MGRSDKLRRLLAANEKINKVVFAYCLPPNLLGTYREIYVPGLLTNKDVLETARIINAYVNQFCPPGHRANIWYKLSGYGREPYACFVEFSPEERA